MKEQTKDDHVAIDDVTQYELHELVELEKVKREAELLRRSIRSRILAGAKIEHGPFYVRISVAQTTQLTIETIRDLLGTLSDEFLAALPQRQSFRMYLNPSGYINKHAKPKAVFDPSSLKANDEPGQELDLTTFVLKAMSLILNKQDATSSSATVEDDATKNNDVFEEHGEVSTL